MNAKEAKKEQVKMLRQRFEMINVSSKEIMVNNSTYGVAWRLGATIGLTIILTLLGLLAKQLNLIPILGSFIHSVEFYISHSSTVK